jgi:hypothetical protein
MKDAIFLASFASLSSEIALQLFPCGKAAKSAQKSLHPSLGFDDHSMTLRESEP